MLSKTLGIFKKNINFSISFNNYNITNRLIGNTAILRQSEPPAEEDTIVVDRDESITLIGINRPKQRNAINVKTAEKLSIAISEFEADKTSPVAVLYGIGGSFCAGYDINELQDQCEKGSVDFLLRHEGSIGPTRRHTNKPIICGISGYCVASGLELALMCDLRVMEDTAVLGFFNRRLGVPISDGGTVRLGSMIGYSRALDLILTGRRITGKEALEIGLINRLVATGTALGQAVNLAFSIAKYPQFSLTQDRNALYVNSYTSHSFHQAIQTEIMSSSKEMLEEMKEGLQRFMNSKTKGASTDSFDIKPKIIPDWEKSEIEEEKKHKDEDKTKSDL